MGQENQENFLGKGGFGEVYKGFWRGQDIGKEHVLKNYEYILGTQLNILLFPYSCQKIAKGKIYLS